MPADLFYRPPARPLDFPMSNRLHRSLIPVLAVLFCLCCPSAHGDENLSAAQITEYRKAAEQGDAQAQCRLAECYGKGLGVTQNIDEAFKWGLKAAEQGNAEAQFYIGGAYSAGGFTARGFKGQDHLEAVRWYRKAADQGFIMAQHNLGNLYATGQGVTKNEAEAAKWYRKAAEQGYAESQRSLGFRYANGEGVVKNGIESYKWFLLAAAQGDGVAKDHVWTNEHYYLSPDQCAEGQRLAQELEARLAKRDAAKEAEQRPATAPAGNDPKVTGTGFLITRNGYLVTNHHVVKGTSKVRVQTVAGLLDAVVVRVDAASDLALLKVTGAFDALPVVSSRSVHLGAMVATVGFPNIGLQGFEPKLSKGDISSLAGVQDDVRQFQISVPVQPGNSGGALVDERGNVVGVVTAQLSQKVALENTGVLAQSVNYAVKSSYLISFLEAVPEVGTGMLDAKTNDRKFVAVVDDVKKAAVLILGY